ncbi:uncharacterized protein LOC111019902 [Momordica charantia]|uniref:Uncharacterized protein LOC111019902 n=1 Tax=Momordica charantia TaxID=3673 RepID=A0A6J1DFB0_MOMCH|nr:uncharacterized protein LOC111019902 [Momordica charantia]
MSYKPPPPYLQRLKKRNEIMIYSSTVFLEVMKQFRNNIPSVEAHEQMPNYVKFFKSILAKKRRLGEFETVAFTKECSAILIGKLPQKMGDTGSFTIPISIGRKNVGHAPGDLGASINLMPLSVYQKLGIEKARPTTVILQLADRLITHPEGLQLLTKEMQVEELLDQLEDELRIIFEVEEKEAR